MVYMVEFPSKKNPVGFVQMGMLQPPPFFGDPSDDSEDKTEDVPYIANLMCGTILSEEWD